MLIVKIIGGLGNQMFQQKGYAVKIDISAYKLHGGYQLDKYNIDLVKSTKEENSKFYTNSLTYRVMRKLNIVNSKIIKEKSLLFDYKLLNIEDGYFQCEKYFKDIILKQFSINQDISNYTKEIENSCSLHIRRGDSTNINIHGACDIEYYKKAIQYLEENINYFIFSDDIENLAIQNAIYIDSKKNPA